jgi:uncharacterized membrane protein (DUF2068 family)
MVLVNLTCMQGLISASDWKRFLPSLLLVLTALVYIPLTVYDIVMHVSVRDAARLALSVVSPAPQRVL